jgi:hypothetical protein
MSNIKYAEQCKMNHKLPAWNMQLLISPILKGRWYRDDSEGHQASPSYM